MSTTETTTAEPSSETPDPTPTPASIPSKPTPPPEPDHGTEDSSKLRDALASERSLRKDAEKRAKEGATAQAELEKLTAAAKSDLERAVEAARKEGAQSVLGSANTRLVNAEARAAAAELKFRNPTLAVRALDLAGITVTDDGTVDTAAITAALKTLAADEPYLIDDGGPRTPRKDPSQGSGKTQAPKDAQKGLDEAARRFGKAAS
jgi:hypothetical protein